LITERLPSGSIANAREFTTLKASAAGVSFVGIEGVEVGATDLAVEINRGVAGTGATPDLVVDYSAEQFEVRAGSGEQVVVLDADGSWGELTRAAGNVTLGLFGFVRLEGNVAFESSTRTVKLAPVEGANAESVITDALLIGGSGVSAFVGVDGGTDGALGLELSDAQFGLALLQARNDVGRSWTSFQATAGGLSFVGIEGLTASASGISVYINQAGKPGDRVVDYGLTAAQGDGDARQTLLQVPTSVATTLTLTMEGAEGEIIKAAGTLDIDLFGFFSVQGQFAVESRKQQVTLSDGTVIKQADLVTIGGNDVHAFAGKGGRRGRDWSASW